MGNLISD